MSTLGLRFQANVQHGLRVKVSIIETNVTKIHI